MNRVSRSSFGKDAAVFDLDECIDTVGLQLIAAIPESRTLQRAGAAGTRPAAGLPRRHCRARPLRAAFWASAFR